MTNGPVSTPADKLLAMLAEDEIERLPLDVVKEQLRERGVDHTVPDSLRRLVSDKRNPAKYLLSLLEEDDVEEQPLPDVIAALKQHGVDHTAGVERIRKVVGPQSPPQKDMGGWPRRALASMRAPMARMKFGGGETTKGARELGVVWTRLFFQLDWMPWAPFHTRLLLTLAACWASVGLQVDLMATFKGAMARNLAAGSTGISEAVAVSLLATAVGALTFGRVADQFGRRFAFSMSMALCALGAALTPFSSSTAMLAAARLIAGIGTGGCCVAVNTTVQELMPARMRGQACLAANASFWLGLAFGALGAVLELDWKVAFWVSAALLSLATLLLARCVPESPRWLVTQGLLEAAERIVEEIKNSLPIGTPTLDSIAPSVSFDTRLGKPTLIEAGRIMCRNHWRALLLCFALMSAQAFFFNISFFNYVDVVQNLGQADTALRQLAFDSGIDWHLIPIALGNFLGPVVFGRWIDGRRGRRRTMAVTFLASGVLLAITAVLFGLAGEGGLIGFGSVHLTAAWTVISFFASTAASTAYTTSGELFPLEIRALAFAIVFAGSLGVGGVVGPLLFDWAAGVGSHAIAAIQLLAALLMVAVAVAVAPVAWWHRRTRMQVWPSWGQVPLGVLPEGVLPERSGTPVDDIVRPISAS